MLKNLLLSSLLLIAYGAHAQPYKTIKTYKPYKWMFGAHWAAIDDDGSKFGKNFDVSNSWNIQPYPTSLTIDRYFIYGWSAELGLTYGKYGANKLVNDTTGVSGMLLSADINGKYSFYNNYAPRARWIDPFFTAGIGFTYRTGTADPYVPTVNLGGGINFWIVKQFGIRISSNAKFAVYPGIWDTKSNYFQHNAGLVFRTPDKSKFKNPNRQKRHKWTKKQPKKLKRKGGH